MKFDVNDIVGKKFGKLTVVKFDHSKPIILKNGIKNGNCYFYLCECECGTKIIVQRNHLIYNHSKSCGCLNFTHNLTYTRLYNIFMGMKQRCYNLKRRKYKIYGERGITICNEWLDDFMAFYNWSIANGYNDKLSIDRIDVNGNYEPSNCRWVNMKIQQRNRTNNHKLTFNNETHSINEWAEILKINRCTIKSRLNRGWTIERTLTTPVN